MYRYQPLLFQPVPSALGYPLSGLVEEVRSAYFPQLEERYEVRIAAEGPLAFMRPNFMGPRQHIIVFHPLLNHPQTPREVLTFIAKHELLHAIVPGQYIDGWWDAHPLMYWIEEHRIAPERFAVWHWLHKNLGRCFVHERDGLRVRRTWRRLQPRVRAPYTPHLPLDAERYENLCPGDGQLRLPPDWVAQPLPLRGGRGKGEGSERVSG